MEIMKLCKATEGPQHNQMCQMFAILLRIIFRSRSSLIVWKNEPPATARGGCGSKFNLYLIFIWGVILNETLSRNQRLQYSRLPANSWPSKVIGHIRSCSVILDIFYYVTPVFYGFLGRFILVVMSFLLKFLCKQMLGRKKAIHFSTKNTKEGSLRG